MFGVLGLYNFGSYHKKINTLSEYQVISIALLKCPSCKPLVFFKLPFTIFFNFKRISKSGAKRIKYTTTQILKLDQLFIELKSLYIHKSHTFVYLVEQPTIDCVSIRCGRVVTDFLPYPKFSKSLLS